MGLVSKKLQGFLARLTVKSHCYQHAWTPLGAVLLRWLLFSTFLCELNYFFWVIKSCLIWLIPYLFNNRFHPGSQVQELGGRVAISLIEISLAPVILVQACSRKQTPIGNLDSSGRCYSGGDRHINNYMKQKAAGAEQRDRHTARRLK